MEKGGLTSFFEDFIEREGFFLDRNVLTTSFSPESILFRDKEIEQLANILAPLLKNERSSNLFIYGNTGTGKTLTVRHVTSNMESVVVQRQIPLKFLYVNCKMKRVADTEYRLIATFAALLGRQLPSTGLPTDEVYRVFYESLENSHTHVLIVLDEVDQLIKKTGSDVLYNLTRVNEELKNSKITLLGISNDTTFLDNLDPRVKSSLSEENLFFAPYNALQMQSILRSRAEKAFRESAIDSGVVEKCAAFAAREHGDARKAIELLRVAGELAERNKSKSISLAYIDEAQEKLENEKIFEVIKNQPKQFQCVLYAILSLKSNTDFSYTSDIYNLYNKLCFKIGLRPLTQRRVSDIIGEFEQLGIISTKTISKGRYGRTREVSARISNSTRPMAKKILEEELEIQ